MIPADLSARLAQQIRRLWVYLSLEPAIFWYLAAEGIILGAGVEKNFMIWKMCRVELGYNETVCDNLEADEHEKATSIVQIEANKIAATDKLLTQWPAVFYVLFAGALSDRFGRRYLICFPIAGLAFSQIVYLIHWTFIWELPVWFFYLDDWHAFLGSFAIFYMGVYGYGSDITEPDGRAQRKAEFATYDGTEIVGLIIGTLISAPLYEIGGFYASYAVRLTFHLISLTIFIRATSPSTIAARKKMRSDYKEEEEEEKSKDNNNSGDEKEKKEEAEEGTATCGIVGILRDFLIRPLQDVWKTVTKQRPCVIRFCIAVTITIYLLYGIAYNYRDELFQYMMKVFPDFTEGIFASMSAGEQALQILVLFGLVPFLRGRMGWHETAVSMLVCLTIVLGLLGAAMSKVLWPSFTLATIIAGGALQAQWSLNRAVITNLVGPDEVGKIYSVMSLCATSTGLFAPVAYKMLYNATVDTLPYMFLVMTSLLYAIAMVGHAFLNSKKALLNQQKKEEDAKEAEKGESSKEVAEKAL